MTIATTLCIQSLEGCSSTRKCGVGLSACVNDHPIHLILCHALRTEIAGLVGDVQFVKAEVEGQKHVAAGPEVFGFPILNFGFSYHLGTVKSYGSDRNRPARISDRFFLGGPMNVRGFNHKGIGPRASPLDGGVVQGDALGGDVSYRGTASIGFPAPLPLFAVRDELAGS